MRKLPFLHIILIFEGVTSLVSQHCNNDDICISEDCIKAAYHLLKNMNLSADPCDDFYQVNCIKVGINLDLTVTVKFDYCKEGS